MNGRWLVQVLWGMVVVALLLAVASLATFQIARALQSNRKGAPHLDRDQNGSMWDLRLVQPTFRTLTSEK